MLGSVVINNMDEAMGLILGLIGGGRKSSLIEKGFYSVPHFNFSNEIGLRDFHARYPEFPDIDASFNSYGVCDNPQQFIGRYKEILAADARTLVVGFTHVPKDKSNAGKGGGWRWHKWGPYIGDGNHSAEHLDDEEGFDDGVWTYHILDITQHAEK